MESHIKPTNPPPNSLEGSIPSARIPCKIRDSACSVTNSVTLHLKYLSICSGIEAATVAWHGLRKCHTLGKVFKRRLGEK